MKISHLEAMTKVLGFDSLVNYLAQRYTKENKPIDEIAFELDIGPKYVVKLLNEYKIRKPPTKIPITKRDVKRLTLDSIAKAHGVSRSTAWRWKCAILRTEKADAKHEDSTELDVLKPLTDDADVPPSKGD